MSPVTLTPPPRAPPQLVPVNNDHTLPVAPRVAVHTGEASRGGEGGSKAVGRYHLPVYPHEPPQPPPPPPPPFRPTDGQGVPLAHMERVLKPQAKPFKRQGDPYAPSVRSSTLASQQSELDYYTAAT